MKSHWLYTLIGFLAIIVLLVFTAFLPDSPSKVLECFAEANRECRFVKARDYLTPESCVPYQTWTLYAQQPASGLQAELQKIEYAILDESTSGDMAIVHVTVGPSKTPYDVPLRKVDGEWKIDLESLAAQIQSILRNLQLHVR